MSNVIDFIYPHCEMKLRNGLKYEFYAKKGDWLHGAVKCLTDDHRWDLYAHTQRGEFGSISDNSYDIIAFWNPLHDLLFTSGVLGDLCGFARFVIMDSHGEWLWSLKPLTIGSGAITCEGGYWSIIDVTMPTLGQIKELGLTWENTLIQVRG